MSPTVYIYTCLPVATIFIVAVTLITATATVTVVTGYAILHPLEHVVSLVLPPISSLACRRGVASSKGGASSSVMVAVACVSLMFGNMPWLINHLCLAIVLGVVLCSIIGVAIVVPSKSEQVSNLASNWAMLLLVVVVFLLAALFTGFVALSWGHCYKGVCVWIAWFCCDVCLWWLVLRMSSHIYRN